MEVEQQHVELLKLIDATRKVRSHIDNVTHIVVLSFDQTEWLRFNELTKPNAKEN